MQARTLHNKRSKFAHRARILRSMREGVVVVVDKPATPAQSDTRDGIGVPCHGYTLFELLIVLSVLTAIAGLSWPTLRKSLTKGQLSDAAKQLRVELARTRLKAIRTGHAQQFRYQPGHNIFEIIPLWPEVEETSESDVDGVGSERSGSDIMGTGRTGATSDRPVGTDLSDESTLTAETAWQELPQGIQFGEPRSSLSMLIPELESGDVIDLVPDEGPREPGASGPLDEYSFDEFDWSAPILFYPNGRTTNARITLKGQRGFEVTVTLRGLTGTARIGPLVRPEQPLSEQPSSEQSLSEQPLSEPPRREPLRSEPPPREPPR